MPTHEPTDRPRLLRRKSRYEKQDPLQKSTWESVRTLLPIAPKAVKDVWNSIAAVTLNSASSLAHPLLLYGFAGAAATAAPAGTPLWATLTTAPIVGYVGTRGVETFTAGIAGAYTIRASSDFLERGLLRLWADGIQLYAEGQGVDKAELLRASDKDIPELHNSYLNDARQLWQHFIRMVGAFGVSEMAGLAHVGVAPPVGATSLAMIPIVVGTVEGTRRVRRRVRKKATIERDNDIEMRKILDDVDPGVIRFLTPFGKDAELLDKVTESIKNASAAKTNRYWDEFSSAMVMAALTGVGSLGSFLLGVKTGIVDPMTQPQMVSLVALHLSVGTSAYAIPQAWSNLETSVRNAARGLSTVLSKKKAEESPDLRTFEFDRSNGIATRLENVTYTRQSADDSRPPFRVHDLSLTLASKGVHVMVGPNGSGKSTAFDVLADIAQPESGVVLMNGDDRNAFKLRSRRNATIAVPQKVVIPYRSTIGDMMSLSCDLSKKDERDRARTLLVDLGLGELLERANGSWMDIKLSSGDRDDAVSGGQLQRIALAAALADPLGRPVLVDEPTNHVSPKERNMVWNVLEKMGESRSIFVITQDVLSVARRDLPVTVMQRTGPDSGTASFDFTRPSDMKENSEMFTDMVREAMDLGRPSAVRESSRRSSAELAY